MSYPIYLPYVCNKNPLGTITKKFGNNHTGVDSITVRGTVWDVCAICTAKVEEVFADSVIGNVVKYGYDSELGHVTLAYYHLADKSVKVKVGDIVHKGTKIGVMGTTGSASTGVHLHVSMWLNDCLVNPEPYLSTKKKLPELKKGEQLMIKKVNTSAGLWLRDAPNTGNTVVLMPNGTAIIVGKTTSVAGRNWGQTCCVINGKLYSGWCCLDFTKEV